MSQNDAFFFAIIGNAVSPGDTFTLKAQEYTLAPEDGFNPLASQTFTGEMYIMDLNGNRLSNTVTVPEPSTTFLLAALSIPLLRRKRP